MPKNSQSWKVTLPCTRSEAEAIEEDLEAFAHLAKPPVLMTSEAEPDNPDSWQMDAYFEGKPPKAAIAIILSMIPSAAGVKPVIEALPDEDWITMSQQGLEPVSAGRFHVRNRTDDPALDGAVNFLIEAGQAFGTGQHETTSGCLEMLDTMRTLGMRFQHVADIGTGTGLLAFAAMSLWPRAQALASDIDPTAVKISEENAIKNGVALGVGQGKLALYVAAGIDNPTIINSAPFDLLIANILAGPLIELAPSLCSLVAEGGTIVLAGLLKEQAEDVIAAYRAQGMRLAQRSDNGDWPTLRLRKRPTFGWRRPNRINTAKRGEAAGFGSI